MLFPLLGGGPGQLGYLRHFEAYFFLDNLEQRDVRCAVIRRRLDQRAAQRARARIELAHTPGNQVNQNVGIANLLQCLPCQFRVQCVVQGASSAVAYWIGR